MLTNLHVKNLALIEEADINFDEGLNILSGETGAGKSILLGSISMALGEKASADIIRKGAEYALTELVFHIDDEEKLSSLRAMDVEELDSGDVIISRKITPSRSQIKVNGMICTASAVKQIASLLLDIHGQHDSRQLLKERSHLDMVDEFGGSALKKVKSDYKKCYTRYQDIKERLENSSLDEEARQREVSFIEYEVNEITAANLIAGEDEELETEFKKMSNAQRIIEEISAAEQLLSGNDENAQNFVQAAIKAVINASAYDDALIEIADSLSVAEDMLSEASRSINSYASDCIYNDEDFNRVSARLDLINSFKMKYGRTIEDILKYCDKRQKKLDELMDYDNMLSNLKSELAACKEELAELSGKLTAARKQAADRLCKGVREGLLELNFMNNEFEADFSENEEFGANGRDSMCFIISTNVGEGLKPLSKVASGGELSRIMLAVKTVIADRDDTETLIFDEIDAGISGKTAQMVAEKLKELSKGRQIICITHLPQIAAYADSHFLIEKQAVDASTVTIIKKLTDEETIMELARLLGGSAITDAVVSNARELKRLAKKQA